MKHELKVTSPRQLTPSYSCCCVFCCVSIQNTGLPLLSMFVQRLEVDLACTVPDFLWRAFKLSITSLTGLCFGRQAQTGRRGTFAKNCCIDATFLAAQLTMLILSITCMNYSYHRCTLYMDKCDQMRTYDYISVFTAYMLWFCDCSLLAAVACVRNIWSPLQRSHAWALCSRCRVGGVCLRQCGIWSCFDLEHEAMDWFLAWLVSSQETRELYRDLEERSKTQACRFWECSVQRLEVDLACAVPDFLWRAFKLSITCWQACALEDKLKQAEEAPLQRIAASTQLFLRRNLQCWFCLSHVWIIVITDVHCIWTNVIRCVHMITYLCLQHTCCDFVIVVCLQQWRVWGTSEVHFRGLTLERSARGAGWVGCVCVNAVFGHVLIWNMKPWIDFLLDWCLHRKRGNSTGTWKRDPKHRPVAFEHVRAPSR